MVFDKTYEEADDFFGVDFDGNEFRGTCEPALIVGIDDENVVDGDEYDHNFFRCSLLLYLLFFGRQDVLYHLAFHSRVSLCLDRFWYLSRFLVSHLMCFVGCSGLFTF